MNIDYPLEFRNQEIAERFKHYEEINSVSKLAEECFGEKPNLEAISINRVYKVIFPSGKIPTMKVRAVFNSNQVHEKLLSAGIEGIPNIVKRIHVKESLEFKFVEWIEGVFYPRALNDISIYNQITDKHYYKLGRLLALITGVTEGNQCLSMSDIYWNNFLIYKDEVRLIDISKVYFTANPDYFFIKQILLDQYIPKRKKEEACFGYFDGIGNRKLKKIHSDIDVLRQFTRGVYAKLGE